VIYFGSQNPRLRSRGSSSKHGGFIQKNLHLAVVVGGYLVAAARTAAAAAFERRLESLALPLLCSNVHPLLLWCQFLALADMMPYRHCG